MFARILRILALLAAAGSVAVMVYAARFPTEVFGDLPARSEETRIAVMAGFGLWIALPFLLAWMAAGRLRGHRVALALLGVGLLAAAAFGLSLYGIAFIRNLLPDPQDPLLFVVVPAYQLAGIALVWALAALVARLGRRGRSGVR
jgi:hypothetical protein